MGFIRTIILFSFYTLFCQIFCERDAKATSCVPWAIQPDTSPRCGEVMSWPNGTIYYKPYELISENERCVWTIPLSTTSGQSKTVEFHILYLGFPSTNDTTSGGPQLLFTGVSRATSALRNIIPSGTGDKFSIEGMSVLITFSSGAFWTGQNYTGFILTYTGDFDPIPIPNQNYNQIQMPPAKMNFVSSIATGSYNEVVTFAFPPSDNYYPGDAYDVIFMENEINNSTGELSVYHFDRNSGEMPWQYAETFSPNSFTMLFPDSMTFCW